jgi:ankyrin repeat protein
MLCEYYYSSSGCSPTYPITKEEKNVVNIDDLYPEIQLCILPYLTPKDISNMCAAMKSFQTNAHILFHRHATIHKIQDQGSVRVLTDSNIIMPLQDDEDTDEEEENDDDDEFDQLIEVHLPLLLKDHVHTTRVSFTFPVVEYDDSLDDFQPLSIYCKKGTKAYIKEKNGQVVSTSRPCPDKGPYRTYVEFRPKPGANYILSCRFKQVGSQQLQLKNIKVESIMYGIELVDLYKTIENFEAKIEWDLVLKFMNDINTPLRRKREILACKFEKHGNTLLNLACLDAESRQAISSLLKYSNKEEVLKKGTKGDTPIHLASLAGNVYAIQKIFQIGGKQSVNSKNDAGRTPLHMASLMGNVDTIKMLIDVGGTNTIADRENDGNYPLHWASLEGHTAAMKVLIDAKTILAVKMRNRNRCTPLHYACRGGYIDGVKLLLESQGREALMPLIMAKDSNDSTPLHWATKEGHIEIVKLLSKAGGQKAILATDKQKWNVLHWACKLGHVQGVKTCIHVGGHAAIMARDYFKKTPYRLAEMNGQVEAMRMIKEALKQFETV